MGLFGWSVVALVVAIYADVLGLGNISRTARMIRLLFGVFIALTIVLLFMWILAGPT